MGWLQRLNDGLNKTRTVVRGSMDRLLGRTADPVLLEEFEAASLRPLPVRWKYAFIHTYKPVLDDASYRAFDTMEDYRRWCEENLPDWLGYGRL